MKRLLIFLSLVFLIPALALFWGYRSFQPLSSDGELKDFLIPKGYSASQIGNKLGKEGLIRSPLAFKMYVQVTGQAKKIQAGEYNLSSDLNLFKVVELLVKGPSEIWVTVPEGFRREEIARRFAVNFEVEDRDGFIRQFMAASADMEGFLFPDTYLFPKTASPSAVVAGMRANFDRKVDSQMKKDIELSEYNLSQIIVMASIVERETLSDAERPLVAGILFKRLEAGWPLQADATVQYAAGNIRCKTSDIDCKWWEPPTGQDISGISSLYNSYRYPGMPPGPIANPGLSSIKAAVYPQSSDYWYYLHAPSGEIYYASTLEEHNQNIRDYLNR